MTTGQARRRWPRWVVTVALTTAVTLPLGAVLAGWRPGGTAAPTAAPPSVEQYQCPMHPAIVEDHPGTCPICGMKLVKVAPKPPSSERKVLFYRSPMDARQTSPVPMKDSMGMDYLPVYQGEAQGSEVGGLSVVDLDVSRQQLIGLRTTPVVRGDVGADIHTVGQVSVDETRVRRVAVKVPGYVDRIHVDFVGKPVKRGQPLFDLYSPEVLAAENEYLVAARTTDGAGGGPLAAAARRKLELWDVPQGELERLAREGRAAKDVTFLSPASGVVTRKDIVEGAFLPAGAMPYEVVDLAQVWVLADVYEPELRFVHVGTPAALRLTGLPGEVFRGTVLFVDPVLNPDTRTARVRLSFPNPAGALRPGMFGEVSLEREPRPVLRVPLDALVRGGDLDVVFVALGGGRFEPRRVVVGESGRDYAEIRSGLEEGEAVVSRANFLIDSESRLRASLARLTTGPSATALSSDSGAAHDAHEAPR